MDTSATNATSPVDDVAYFEGQGNLATRLKMSRDDLDELYANAYACLNERDTKTATGLFVCLTWLDHHNMDYWLGLGIAHQLAGDHAQAVTVLSHGAGRGMEHGDVDARLLRAIVSSLEWLGHTQMARDVAAAAASLDEPVSAPVAVSEKE